jgi:RecQ-mediated genome instability protein 1
LTKKKKNYITNLEGNPKRPKKQEKKTLTGSLLLSVKMTRRRLRLSSYSDDDDDEEEQQNQQQDYQMESHQLPNPNPNPNLPEQPVPLPISSDDAEFADASDNLTPPSPPYPPSVAPPISGCPIGDFLLRTGLSLKREWLDSCLRQIDNSLDIVSKAKLCFGQFLISDMNHCGAGVLPPNVDSMHLADLPGPFVLQVAYFDLITNSVKLNR